MHDIVFLSLIECTISKLIINIFFSLFLNALPAHFCKKTLIFRQKTYCLINVMYYLVNIKK